MITVRARILYWTSITWLSYDTSSHMYAFTYAPALTHKLTDAHIHIYDAMNQLNVNMLKNKIQSSESIQCSLQLRYE